MPVGRMPMIATIAKAMIARLSATSTIVKASAVLSARRRLCGVSFIGFEAAKICPGRSAS
jgi:hypothetical protein